VNDAHRGHLRSKGSLVATVTETTTVTGLLAELATHNIARWWSSGRTGWSAWCPSATWCATCTSTARTAAQAGRRHHDHGPGELHPDDAVDDLSALMTNNRGGTSRCWRTAGWSASSASVMW
jgi:hypothetical protein